MGWAYLLVRRKILRLYRADAVMLGCDIAACIVSCVRYSLCIKAVGRMREGCLLHAI